MSTRKGGLGAINIVDSPPQAARRNLLYAGVRDGGANSAASRTYRRGGAGAAAWCERPLRPPPRHSVRPRGGGTDSAAARTYQHGGADAAAGRRRGTMASSSQQMWAACRDLRYGAAARTRLLRGPTSMAERTLLRGGGAVQLPSPVGCSGLLSTGADAVLCCGERRINDREAPRLALTPLQ